MATFTSVTSGNWNDGATWGKTSPGAKGVDWPGNNNDVVNIGTTSGQSHAVYYNVSETNTLGQVTIGATSGTAQSRLDFATNMSTKLALSQQDILVQLTGELRIGTSGAVLSKDYTAEIVWTLISNNTKGISFPNNGGKLTLYGDPDYYGGDFDTYLYSSWNGSDLTIYLAGDFSGKWLNGQELLIHKGGVYGTNGYANDLALVSINGAITYDGTKSTVPIAIVHVPSPGTFAAGGDVLNVSRNIMLYPTGYSHNIYAIPGNGLRFNNPYNPGATICANNVQASGWTTYISGYSVNTDNSVMRNGISLLTSIKGGSALDIIVYSSSQLIGMISNLFAMSVSGYFCGASNCGINQLNCCWTPSGKSIKVFSNVKGINGNNFNITAFVYSNQYGYASASAQYLGDVIFNDGAIGYNQAGNSCPNSSADLSFIYGVNSRFINTKWQPVPPTVTDRNNPAYPGRYSFEDYNQVVGEHYMLDAYGDIYKVIADGSSDHPTQRSGGNGYVIEVVPQSSCSADSYLEIFKVRLWAEAGLSKTYRFYVQTDFTALAKSVLVLYGEYLDNTPAGTGHRATASSSGAGNFTTRANTADWGQYVEVTINPTQDGYVNLYLRLMGYEEGKKVWIDPKPEGAAMIPRWSYGDVVLEPITAPGGGSVSPTNLGLVPLGIKQVAI